MFPQLVAGPIVRYFDIEKEIRLRNENFQLFGEGVEQFLLGLGKKVLLANNVGMLWNTIKGEPLLDITTLSAWLGIFAFTFQIYFDFSGYSDMAIGLGKMFGFHINKNFDLPYTSRSITEFWSRWHISLSTWFKEYVYIPLGGNRKGSLKQYRNIFVVWILTGFWHGANWNFIIWGLYYCVFLLIEKHFLGIKLKQAPSWISHGYTLLIVIVGWVIFEISDLNIIVGFIQSLSGFAALGWVDSVAVYQLMNYGPTLILCGFFSSGLCSNIKKKYFTPDHVFLWAIYQVVLFFIFFLSVAGIIMDTYNPYLYFRF